MEKKYGPVVLSQRGAEEGKYANHWWVSRIDTFRMKREEALDCEYLRADGTWHYRMDTKHNGDGGTYFKTLEDVIAVLAEFEINVIGRE